MIYEVKKTQTLHNGLQEELHSLLRGFPGPGITEVLHKYLICYDNFCMHKIKNSHSISFEVFPCFDPQRIRLPAGSWWRVPRSSPVWLLTIEKRPLPPTQTPFVGASSLWSPTCVLILTCKLHPRTLLWQSTPHALLCPSERDIHHLFTEPLFRFSKCSRPWSFPMLLYQR